MRALGGFVPGDRRSVLAVGGAFPEQVAGAALFCDVSGFSRLSTRLVEIRGRHRGADELSDMINRAFDRIVGHVEAGGGAVVSFAGDAVTCWFDDAGVPGAGTARAAACALTLSADGGSVGESAEGLGLKVAVASGTARRIVVGDDAIQLFDVLAGPLVDALEALHAASWPGEVVVSADAARLLAASGGELDASSRPDGGTVNLLRAAGAAPTLPVRTAVEVAPEEALRWVPRAIRARMAMPGPENMTDLRPVTPMFVGFGRGAAGDADVTGAHLGEIVAWAQEVVDAHGGMLLDVTVGDKGRYLCSVFGAPVVHENDVDRALDAALALRRPPPSLGIGGALRIGVSRGSALVGIVGSPSRCRFGVVGQEMNVAAHVMTHAAEGEILVTDRVATRAGRRFALVPRGGRIALKGLDEPAPVFSVVARRPGAAAPAPSDGALAERDAELAVLRAALAELEEGRGGVVLIEAEAGLGKTRLLEAARAMAAPGTLWLAAAGDEMRRAQAYRAWREVFDGLRARGLTGEPHGPIEALLRFLFDGATEEPAALAGLAGPDRAAAMVARLAGILRAAADTAPLVVSMDDLHWLDSASLGLLLRVAAEGGPVLVILAGRPAVAPSPERAALAAAAGERTLMLRPLSESAIVSVTAARLGAAALTYDLTRLLTDRAGGSPLFAEEIAGVLRARALVRVEDGICVPSPSAPRLETVDFLESVETVIAARVDQLPLDLRRVLRVASVAGRAFDRAMIEPAIAETGSGSGVEAQLERLRHEGLVVAETTEAGRRYAIRHPMIREAILHSIPFAERRAIHARCSDWWMGSADPAAIAERARHLARAVDHDAATDGEIDAAVVALDEAATRATRDFANLEASTFFEEALTLLARLPAGAARNRRELDMQARLALSLATFRGYADPAVARAYGRALELAEAAGDSPYLAFIVYGIFSFYSASGDQGRALRTVRRLHRMARSGDLPTRSVTHQSRGIVALLRGRLATARRQLGLSYDLAERHGGGAFFSHGSAGDFRTFTGAWIALSEAVAGHVGAARAAFDTALERAGAGSFAGCFVRSFCPLPVLDGDPARAAAFARALIDASEAHGFALFSAVGRIYLGWAEARLSRDAAVLPGLDGGLQLTIGMKLGSFTPWFLALKADACLAAGRREEAREALAQARTITDEQGDTLFESEIRRGEAALARADGATADTVAAMLAEAASVAWRRGAHLLARRAAGLEEATAAIPSH